MTFGAVDVVIIADQDPVRTRLVPKLAGRLKSLGCCVVDPVLGGFHSA